MTRLDRRGRLLLAVAGSVWAAAAAGQWWGWPVLAAVAGVGVVASAVGTRPLVPVAAVLVAAGAWAGIQAEARAATVLAFETTAGPFEATVRLLGDPRAEVHGWWALGVAEPPEPGRPPAVPMLISFREPVGAVAGDTIMVQGRRSGRTGTARGDPYSGVVTVGTAERASADRAAWWTAGNAVRVRALERLQGAGPSRALLAGFLVGDTSDVPEADLEAMRRSGLSHLVAVSGSNVALFLMLTLVAAGPLAAGPRRRAVVGIVALVILAIATRWEPSVMRASVMAGLVLAGRVGGWALDTASALAVTVIGVVVISGDMATDVGFALSVLATLGVIIGGSWRPEGLYRPAAATLGATVGAQLLVAPLLLAVFGSIPLMAPLTNLIAAPVVAAATASGAIGVALGWDLLIGIAAGGAWIVLAVARVAAVWPQLGWAGFGLAAAVMGLGVRPRARPAAAVLGAALVAVSLLGVGNRLVLPGAVVLDVGQGDAVLVVAGDGSTMLVDGGPDPARLEAKLAEYGVRSLDLVVISHYHADHVTGLEAVVGRRPVGEIWTPGPHHATPLSEALLETARALGIPVREAPTGSTYRLGDLDIEILGPLRRYESANDQSVVLRVRHLDGPRLLLTGDIEAIAQAELGMVAAEILKVPHHGGATSDLGWLADVGAQVAVIPVGVNDFGHPHPDVLGTLEMAGVEVRRTDLDGDVALPLR